MAIDAGLKIGPTGGIHVDSTMQTSDANIYAAGDLTGQLPLSSVASMQGRKIALQLAMDTLGLAKDEGLLKADHMLHLRCEIPAPHQLDDIARVIPSRCTACRACALPPPTTTVSTRSSRSSSTTR